MLPRIQRCKGSNTKIGIAFPRMLQNNSAKAASRGARSVSAKSKTTFVEIWWRLATTTLCRYLLLDIPTTTSGMEKFEDGTIHGAGSKKSLCYLASPCKSLSCWIQQSISASSIWRIVLSGGCEQPIKSARSSVGTFLEACYGVTEDLP